MMSKIYLIGNGIDEKCRGWFVGVKWVWLPVGNASCPDTSDYLYLTEYVCCVRIAGKDFQEQQRGLLREKAW